jgi:hypothetical protein
VSGYDMDNFRIDITALGDNVLAAAIALAFGDRKAIGYMVSNNNALVARLVFLWSMSEKREGMIPLPFKMAAPQAAEFARAWLAEADYGQQPDHDGDNSRGWRVFNEAWGHVDGLWGAIVAVQPAWAMHGK